MTLETWMIERDTVEYALNHFTRVPEYWKEVQEEAEQEIERILRT